MRRRVLLTVVAVCALGITVLFIPMALVIRAQNQHIDQLELQRLAAAAARTAPADPTHNRTWQPADTDPHHRYGLYDARGTRIAGTGPPTADAVVRDALRGGVATGRHDADITAAASMSTPFGGAVRVAESVQESTARTAAALARLLALAVATIAIAAVIGWFLVRRLLAPVTALRNAATQLGHGDFTVKIPDTRLDEFDEIGQALTSSAHRIRGLIERERAFTADASHQLRNPLAAVIVALETELLAPRPDSRTIVTESLHALIQMKHTITNLLQLARDTATTHDTTPLAALLRDLYDRWSPAFTAAGRPLTVPPITGDAHVSPVAVHHILDVLLDNALRHGRGNVTLNATPVQGGVAITVTDAGPGPRHPDNLFHRRDITATGTGIGLALARSLAEAEGARLNLRNPGAPTTFELLIPHPDPS
ncbi:sensor histidine kinase [Mycolicibacterium tusciae]|uniref:sensor histidine kinase n=1 Tax=Mycolicibacterium tusciae TaxID=75922 RepID=UPI00024A2E18|nr:HAMP domain-containing sensor histidine kinase [Mycolicibacterium tusciae]